MILIVFIVYLSEVCLSLVLSISISAQGFDQLLWLFGDDNIVTEAGTSNFFVHWKNTNGEEEIVTAPLDGEF